MIFIHYMLDVQPTEEDYEQVPVKQFGLALLRGMGWKDGDGVGRTPRYLMMLQALYSLN